MNFSAYLILISLCVSSSLYAKPSKLSDKFQLILPTITSSLDKLGVSNETGLQKIYIYVKKASDLGSYAKEHKDSPHVKSKLERQLDTLASSLANDINFLGTLTYYAAEALADKGLAEARALVAAENYSELAQEAFKVEAILRAEAKKRGGKF